MQIDNRILPTLGFTEMHLLGLTRRVFENIVCHGHYPFDFAIKMKRLNLENMLKCSKHGAV